MLGPFLSSNLVSIVTSKGKDASNNIQRLGQGAVVKMEILLLDRTWKLCVRVRIR